MHWLCSDVRLPGLELSAAVLASSDGVGMVLDVNVSASTAEGAAGAELIWGWGCAVKCKECPIGWAKDPLIHSDVLSWDFSPEDCKGNLISLGTYNTSATTTFSSGSNVSIALQSTAPSPSLFIVDSTEWKNASALLGNDLSARRQESDNPAISLPLPGATLWLRASSLNLANGSMVGAWTDDSPSAAVFTQMNETLQPVFLAHGLGDRPAVSFNGVSAYMSSLNASTGSESTMFVVLQDDGSVTDCCSGALFFMGAFTGISTLRAPGAADDDDTTPPPTPAPPKIVTTLDFQGSAAYGHTNIGGRPVVASAIYTSNGLSYSLVDGCLQGSARLTPQSSSGGALLGRRAFDVPDRHFRGAIGEVVVFPRALNASEISEMHAYFFATWPALVPKHSCTPQNGPMLVGRSPLPPAASPNTTTRFTWAVSAAARSPLTPSDPLAIWTRALSRRTSLASLAVSSTPDDLLDSSLPALSFAVDGLFRSNPGAFVHGAMAWDALYLGWRSQYGAVVLGAAELAESEGRYFMAQQKRQGVTATGTQQGHCKTDPATKYTRESSDSRLHGEGRIDANGGNYYDMQTQFFDQQIHAWRWTGNATHAALLYPALQLHAQWAADCFDSDGNGLFSSYTNTWPTDSQFYSGGETYEQTAYMHRVHLALRDLALSTGNTSAASAYNSSAAFIRAAAQDLWIAPLGIPASHREEGGHRRLRPDPWLYSIFLPIEGDLWDAETSAQALHFTEYGLERNSIPCTYSSSNYFPVASGNRPSSSSSSSSSCVGEVVWTSNWVPSMWSVRQLWSGDNFGLALAYFLAGLPEEGYTILAGTLRWNMLQSVVPGQAGGVNGGTDFNDCVHPGARAIVEGLFGFHPDYGVGLVTVSPQFPGSWERASFYGRSTFSMQYATDLETFVTLTVSLVLPTPVLKLVIPIRAGVMNDWSVSGAADATIVNSTEAGFGQSVLILTISSPSGALLGGRASGALTAHVSLSDPLPVTSSVFYTVTPGENFTLSPPRGVALRGFSDPQGLLVPGSASIVGGSLLGTLSPEVSGPSTHMLFGTGFTTAGDLPQTILVKLNVTASLSQREAARRAAPPAPATASSSSSWTYIPLGAAANGNLLDIFKADTYITPRPETCAVRIASDGWSAWTHVVWGTLPPVADFSNVPNLTIAPGPIIETPQGARFLLNSPVNRSIAFATLWDNYPNVSRVEVVSAAGRGSGTGNRNSSNSSGVWVLLAGSTHPMQTRLACGVLRFLYAGGGGQELPLVPPFNYWALSGWGPDYDYNSTAFCLPPTPPPTVTLGANCRAMVYYVPLPQGALLEAVELEALSQEVVLGILAVSLMGE